MRPVEFELEIKTPNRSNGDRVHWAVIAKERKNQRRAVGLKCPPLKPDPALVVTLTRRSSGTLDDDGLRTALKSARDAIAAKLRVDDATPLVRWEYRQEPAPPGRQALHVRVESLLEQSRCRPADPSCTINTTTQRGFSEETQMDESGKTPMLR